MVTVGSRVQRKGWALHPAQAERLARRGRVVALSYGVDVGTLPPVVVGPFATVKWDGSGTTPPKFETLVRVDVLDHVWWRAT